MKKGAVREMREPLGAERPDKLEVLVLEDANWRISAWQEGEVVDTGFKGFGKNETYKRLKVKSRHVRIEKLDCDGNVLKKEEREVKGFYKSWLISVIEDCQIEGASDLIERDSYIAEHKGKKYEFKQTKILGKLFRRHRKEYVSRKQERYTASSIYHEYYLPAYPTSKLCPERLFEDLGLDPEKGYTRKQIYIKQLNKSTLGMCLIPWIRGRLFLTQNQHKQDTFENVAPAFAKTLYKRQQV